MNERGEEVKESDTIGELVYKGPNVMMGYGESKKDLICGDVNHGVIYTGDIGKKDLDGYYYLVGRKKRIIKVNGKRISLDALEELIINNCSMEECVCCGRDENCIVFIKDKEKKGEVELFITRTLSLNIRYFKVYVIHNIPKNENGKVRYSELEALYLEDY